MTKKIHEPINQTPIVLYSGGLDSFVVTGMLIAGKWFAKPPILVHFTTRDKSSPLYQTTHELLPAQVKHLSKMAGGAKIKVHKVCKDKIVLSAPNRPFPHPTPLPLNHEAKYYSYDVAFIGTFLCICFNYAAMLDSDYVITGFQQNEDYWRKNTQNDPNDASDDGPRFVKAWNKMGDFGLYIPSQQLIAPLLDEKMSKADIMRMGLDLGMPLELTQSCTQSRPRCGRCIPCERYAVAIKALGFDPTVKHKRK